MANSARSIIFNKIDRIPYIFQYPATSNQYQLINFDNEHIKKLDSFVKYLAF